MTREIGGLIAAVIGVGIATLGVWPKFWSKGLLAQVIRGLLIALGVLLLVSPVIPWPLSGLVLAILGVVLFVIALDWGSWTGEEPKRTRVILGGLGVLLFLLGIIPAIYYHPR